MPEFSEKMKNPSGIYLFNAPFFAPGNPYVSVPTLAAFLQEQNITCRAFDLGQEFWHRFITVERIKRGIAYAETKFLQLNQQQKLSFRETVEYKRVLSLLELIDRYKQDLQELFQSAEQDENSYIYQRKPLSSFCVTLTTAPFFPNHMITEPMLKLFSDFDEFSSRDILAASKTDFFYSEGLQRIVTDIFSADEPPRVAGISLMCQSQVAPGFFCARLIKELSPATHVVMGGAFVSLHLRELDTPDLFQCCDSFIVDDGEIPLTRLYQELGKDSPAFDKIPGLIWQQNKIITINPPEPPLKLETLPIPDYTVFALNRYFSRLPRVILPFRLSRGCYWQRCTFCRTEISFCKDYEQPSVSVVFENLCHLIKTTGVQRIFFSDESSRPDVLEFIARNLIERGIEIEWLAHTRFHSSLTRERFQLYKKSGCLSLTLGLEACNDRILTLMDKGTSMKLVNKVLAANDGCLPLNMYMIIGFPSETETEARAGFEKVKNMKKMGLINDFSYSVFQLIYGSDIWKNSADYGINEIQKPSRQNLFPEIVSFSSSGMSRKRVVDLYIEFTTKISSAELFMTMFNEVKVNGKTIPLNHNFGRLKTVIDEHLYKLYSMPYGEWLESVPSDSTGNSR